MYECEAENGLKITKAFIIIDGKIEFILKQKFKILNLESTLMNITISKQQRISSSSSSPSYGRFHLYLVNGK
jgi:hypothetical protein